MNKEIWKDIKDYEELYQISNLGRIRSKNRITKNKYCKYIKKGKMLRCNDNNLGYKFVYLFKNKKSKKFYIHRLVAIHFIENKENKPYINHIDCNPSNNIYLNLEWCTPQENTQYMFKMGRENRNGHWKIAHKKFAESLRKKVVAVNQKTNEIIIYNYMNEVKKDGHSPGEVCKCCKNNYYTHHKYKWYYFDDWKSNKINKMVD